MSRFKIIPLIILLLISFGAALLYLSQDEISKIFDGQKSESIDNVISGIADQPEEPDYSNSPKVPEAEFTTSGWIPDWASPAGLTSLQSSTEKFDSISPVWYEINEDGTLKNKRPKNASQIESFSRSNSIELIPAIAMFDHELFTKVLQNQENLDRHVQAIVDEVEARNYGGIDLDYESTKLSDKDKFFEFLQKLSDGLKEKDKTLVVTVIAQWDRPVEYSSLKETRAVQDWTMITEYADYIRIMAYDYTFVSSPNPGPIAPINWIEEVLDYAVKKIPREKIILGIHLYSYEWYCQIPDFESGECTLEFTPISYLNIGESRSARSYTYSTVKEVVGKFGNELSDFQGEKVYRYQKANPQTGKQEKRLLVYIDPAGVQSRIDLAKQYGIKGVVFWRIGGEDELI